MVTDWTWNVTYKFDTINGIPTKIDPHGIAVPGIGAVDLPTAVKVPASPGYGLPQAEAAVLRAEAAAVSSAEDASLAEAAADRAEQVAGATDAGVASLLRTTGTATRSELDSRLATKADLVGGKVPVGQLPTDALVTDANVAAQINGAQTGPAIDARINTQVSPQVEQIAADYIASQPAVVDAAAAAVDANPKIASIEAALPYMGEIADGTDFNTIRVPGIYGVRAQSTALTMINIPRPYPGMLIVQKPRPANVSQVYIGSGTGGYPSKDTRITRSDTTWTGPWASDRNMQGFLPNGTNLDTFQNAGDWIITPTIAATLTGWPSWVPVGYATLNVKAEVRAIAFGGSQTLRVLLPNGGYQVLDRVTAGETFGAWPSDPAAELDAGLSNSVLVQDWSRRMGGRKKVTTATVAFRFDHGLLNFDTKIRAELESRGFKYSLALCSGQWDRTENVGVTPAMVNSWVQAGKAEIWNHSVNHSSGDGTEAGWKSAILDGLNDLRAQLPAAQIDGFAIPGSAGTNFGGLTDGLTLEQFHATPGGKFVLSHHAVASGYVADDTRWQDGTPRQALGHYTLDARTLADVQALVASAQKDRRAIQFMLHPSRLDTAGYITTAEFLSILNYVQGEQNAGRLKVVSPYEQLLTDVTGTVQGNDTGRRDITALFNGTAPNAVTGIAGGNVYLTRVGRMVELDFENVTLPPGQSTSFVNLGDIIPAGFQPPNERDYPLGMRLTAEAVSGGNLRVNRATGRIYIYLHVDGETIRVTATWFTEDPWPAVLPGTAVGSIPSR